MGRQKLRTLNAGNLLVLLGLGWLGIGFYMPYATADRVYRIEKRAARTAAALQGVVASRAELDLKRPGIARELADAANAALDQTDPESSLYLHVVSDAPPASEPAAVLEGKHYYFMVTKTPLAYLGVEPPVQKPGEPKPAAPPPKEVAAPYEVYAWPRLPNKSGQTVFFYCTSSPPAFTRNLALKYVGLRKAPEPGAGALHHANGSKTYYGQDEGRWHYLGAATK